MGAPQIIWVIIVAITLLVSANKHGESKGEYNVIVDLIGAGLAFVLLWWGGFFG